MPLRAEVVPFARFIAGSVSSRIATNQAWLALVKIVILFMEPPEKILGFSVVRGLILGKAKM